MKHKKIIYMLLFIFFSYVIFGFVKDYQTSNMEVKLSFQVKANEVDDYQLFYLLNNGEKWSEKYMLHSPYETPDEWKEMSFTLPKKVIALRIDFGSKIGTIRFKDLELSGVTVKKFNFSDIEYKENQLKITNANEKIVTINTMNKDPFLTFPVNSLVLEVTEGTTLLGMAFKIFISCFLSILLIIVLSSVKDVFTFFKALLSDRGLIINLGKNDFRTKYASSYLGITWGFVQPLITIATYWFVFQVGLRSGNVSDTPFILWLLVAIVPWFFFSEALSSATNVFSEYSYLVKKVVFKIELLPMVKISSAFFVHIFFILFIFIIYSIYGYYPSLYNIQIVYYVACTVVLVTSLSILTSALVLFFKDLNQIIIIILQVGFWFTPIGWSYTMLPSNWEYVFKLNPMFYIVEGFRDSFIFHTPFYDHPYYTFYFWLFCFVSLVIGIKTFGKLKPHFADVL